MSPKKSKARWWFAWPTAWGAMAAAAGNRGVCRVVLPHYQPDELRELMAWEHAAADSDEAPFATLIDLSRRYFNGEPVDFAEVQCDLPSEGSFTGKVLRACREIPYGRTRSYLDLARAIGQPDAARAVATAMSKNALPLVIPCHRVIYSDGRAGGYSAAGGEAMKRRMLTLEAGRA